MPLRHGGQILIDQLKIQGCRRVFCVPGESYLPALDGLAGQDTIATVVCRQEGGAAMMAEATGKMTGQPGICFVTRGPGATNASAGVHIAKQDSTPMILFIGQIDPGTRDREAFQEVDYRLMFAPLAKWVAEIDDTARIPEYVSQAYHRATSGRPGPVVLSLPETILSASIEVEDAKPATPIEAKAAAEDMTALAGPAPDGRTAAGVYRRRRLEPPGHRIHDPRRRAPQPAARHRLPLSGLHRQPSPALRPGTPAWAPTRSSPSALPKATS